jgi:hypothetical protein
MSKIRKYLDDIIEKDNKEDMEKLSEIFEELMYHLKECNHKKYKKYKICLYEMAYGKKLTEEMAIEWINNMRPVGLHWTEEETTEVMNKMGYNCDKLSYWVVSNMMYNDNYNIVKDDEELALKLAYYWLDDEDAVADKFYEYWKYIPDFEK